MPKPEPMPPEQAFEIVRAIARGEDPYEIGTPLRAVSLVQAQTVHALCVSIASLLENNRRDPMVSGGTLPIKIGELPQIGELPPCGELSLDEYLAQIESNEIHRCLDAAKQNMTKAARNLGITFRALRYKLESSDGQRIPLTINIALLPPRNSTPLDDFLSAIERKVITDMLAETKYNKTEAARRLGLTYRAFRYRLESLQLDV